MSIYSNKYYSPINPLHPTQPIYQNHHPQWLTMESRNMAVLLRGSSAGRVLTSGPSRCQPVATMVDHILLLLPKCSIFPVLPPFCDPNSPRDAAQSKERAACLTSHQSEQGQLVAWPAASQVLQVQCQCPLGSQLLGEWKWPHPNQRCQWQRLYT